MSLFISQAHAAAGPAQGADGTSTQGGIVGKIVKVSDEKDFIVVSIAEGTEVTVQKGAINAVLPKGTMKSL